MGEEKGGLGSGSNGCFPSMVEMQSSKGSRLLGVSFSPGAIKLAVILSTCFMRSSIPVGQGGVTPWCLPQVPPSHQIPPKEQLDNN